MSVASTPSGSTPTGHLTTVTADSGPTTRTSAPHTQPTVTNPARQRAATIRSARLTNGWTQADLGHRAGYSQPTISRIEDGGFGVNDITVLTRLAAILAINPTALGITAEQTQPDRQPQRRAPIGVVIGHLRRRRGLSQTACAQLSGFSESWLSQVERGTRPIDSIRAIRELARVLDVDVHKLIEVVL